MTASIIHRSPATPAKTRIYTTDTDMQTVTSTPTQQGMDILKTLNVPTNAAGATLQVRSPVDGAVLGTLKESSVDDVHTAVAHAQSAFLQWRDVPAPLRGELVRLFGDDLAKLYPILRVGSDSARFDNALDAASPASFQPVNAARTAGERSSGWRIQRTCSTLATRSRYRPSRHRPGRRNVLTGTFHTDWRNRWQLYTGCSIYRSENRQVGEGAKAADDNRRHQWRERDGDVQQLDHPFKCDRHPGIRERLGHARHHLDRHRPLPHRQQWRDFLRRRHPRESKTGWRSSRRNRARKNRPKRRSR